MKADLLNNIEPALDCLRKGGVLLYPTDIQWEFGADATHPAAVQKILSLTQQDRAKGLIILLADQREILQYLAAPDPELFDYLDALHEPTTIWFDGAIGLAEGVASEEGTVGIRLVQDPFCRHLIKRLGSPLVSTPVQGVGAMSSLDFNEINPALKAAADHVVNYRQGLSDWAGPSRWVRWTANGPQELQSPS